MAWPVLRVKPLFYSVCPIAKFFRILDGKPGTSESSHMLQRVVTFANDPTTRTARVKSIPDFTRVRRHNVTKSSKDGFGIRVHLSTLRFLSSGIPRAFAVNDMVKLRTAIPARLYNERRAFFLAIDLEASIEFPI